MTAGELARTKRRFLKRVFCAGPGGCWQWLGYRTPDGHGQFRYDGRTEYAHRAVLKMMGFDVEGKVVRHMCNNPACVNPRHLVIGTQAENVLDRVRAGRSARGERNGRAKLTWLDVKVIRREYRLGGVTFAELAGRFGVDERQIARIVRGQVWREGRWHGAPAEAGMGVQGAEYGRA